MTTRMQAFLEELMSTPVVREAIHKKMVRLEKKLSNLASIFFGQKITIIYSAGIRGDHT